MPASISSTSVRWRSQSRTAFRQPDGLPPARVGVVDAAAEVGDPDGLAQGGLGEDVAEAVAERDLLCLLAAEAGRLVGALGGERPPLPDAGSLADGPFGAELVVIGADPLDGDGLEAELQRGRVGLEPIVVARGIDEERVGEHRVGVGARLAPLIPGQLRRRVGDGVEGDAEVEAGLGVDAVVVEGAGVEVLLVDA